jgi:hypothetical protein
MTVTPGDILTHIKTYLPVVSTDFSTSLAATATAAGSVVTFVAAGHGLAVGASIGIAGGEFENALLSYVDNEDGTARFGTTDEHDLTQAKDIDDPTTLTLSGFGNLWDGDHTIRSIPNRMFFEIDIPTGAPNPPGLAGAVLLEDRSAGLIGVHTIASVPDVNSFTVDFPGVPPFPTGVVTSTKVVSGYRIYAAANIDRAEKVYTKLATDSLVLFLIMDDAEISKDRHAINDAISADTSQNYGRQLILQNFSVVVFFPTASGDLSGGIAQSMAYGQTYRELYSVLYGKRITDPETPIKYLTVNNGHGPGQYTSAYYSHVYAWQLPTILTFEDSVNIQQDVAFRDANLSFNQGGQLLDATIDLDKEQL